jgi:urease accessory protein
VATQSSTKVYRSARGTAVDVRARVASGATLVFMPDPVVCFTASRYAQRQRFDVASRSRLVVVDWLSSGRTASGERWQFDEYVSTLQIRVDGSRVVHDALALRASDGDLGLRLGEGLRATSAAIVDGVARSPVTRRDDLIVAAAPVGSGGCLLRVAGRSVEHVSRVIREQLAIVPALLGDNPWARKW